MTSPYNIHGKNIEILILVFLISDYILSERDERLNETERLKIWLLSYWHIDLQTD